MKIDQSTKVVFNKDMVVANENGATILLNNQKHVIYILKEFESELINIIEKNQTFRDIMNEVEASYVGDNVEEEFYEFIKTLEAAGVISLIP